MDILNKIKRVFYPQNYRCTLCGAEIFEGSLCKDCADKIPLNNGAACPVCGRKTAVAEICMECKADAPVYKKAASPLVYDDGVIQLIGRYKHGSGWLADYFAPLMAQKLATLPQFDVITYVPCSKRAKFNRGYDQAQLLAERISAICGVPVVQAVLKVKRTKQQKTLTRKERLKNLAGSFKGVRQAVKGLKVLVVDDVLTTGATLDSVSMALKKAGATHIYALTAASVEYKDGRRAKDKN